MEILILVVVGFLIVGWYQNWNASRPQKFIEDKEIAAMDFRQRLMDNLEKGIKDQQKLLNTQISMAGIKKPKQTTDDLLKFQKKLENNVITQDTQQYIRLLKRMKTNVVPEFENNYARLKIRHKMNVAKLVEIADDYLDWYRNVQREFDQDIGYYVERDIDDMNERRVVIDELNKKLDFVMKLNDDNG